MNTHSLPVDHVETTWQYKVTTFNKWGPVWETRRATKKGVHDVVQDILLNDDYEYFQVEMIKE